MTVRYVVLDENSLGVIHDATPNWFEPLASNIDGPDPMRGSIPIFVTKKIRPATLSDFAKFRLMPPPEMRRAALIEANPNWGIF